MWRPVCRVGKPQRRVVAARPGRATCDSHDAHSLLWSRYSHPAEKHIAFCMYCCYQLRKSFWNKYGALFLFVIVGCIFYFCVKICFLTFFRNRFHVYSSTWFQNILLHGFEHVKDTSRRYGRHHKEEGTERHPDKSGKRVLWINILGRKYIGLN